MKEERSVYVKCDGCSICFNLGEQAGVVITVGNLEEYVDLSSL